MRRHACLKTLALLSAFILLFSGIHTETEQIRQVRAQRQVIRRLRRLVQEEEGSQKIPPFEALREINPEFQCWLAFESGLVSLPAVQHGDNSWWLTHLFDGTPGAAGTVFFDTQCERTDEVRILYGHSVFYEPSLMFTPLHLLKKEEEFIRNRKFSLLYEDGTEEYEIFAAALIDDSREDSLPVRIRGFQSPQERRLWLKELADTALVYSGEVIREDSRIVILQTCEKEEGPLRLCIFAADVRG